MIEGKGAGVRFHQRTYLLYLVLGKGAPSPIYEWVVWRSLVPALDPLIGAARGRPAVKSYQVDQATRRRVPFGKLGWEERSHMRWTHHSPLTAGASSTWIFDTTQIYAPHWPTCVREDAAPDVYIHLHAEPTSQDGPFDIALLIALHEKLPQHILERAAPAAVAAAARRMSVVLVATQNSPWGLTAGPGYTDIIEYYLMGLGQSLQHTGYRAGLTVSSLPGHWRPFPAP